MQFKKLIAPVLNQLADTILKVDKTEFAQKSNLLNGSSIGGHTRHVIELFQCLLTGYTNGHVNYENRKRDLVLETDNEIASSVLYNIAYQIEMPDKKLLLKGFFAENEMNEYTLETNYYREIIYNLEHTIHHMALIRVGIKELTNLTLEENFGVAPSTIQHKKQLCAQ